MKYLFWMKIDGICLSKTEISEILDGTGLTPVNYLYEEDKTRHYLGIFLAKEILKKNGTFNGRRISKNSFGKPFFEAVNGLYFNISHSENLVVCAFANNEIGIDVEKIREFPNEILENIYTSNEKQFIHSSGDIDRASFLIWTVKESYLKYKGLGIAHLDKVFDVVREGKLIESFEGVKFEQVQLCDDYVTTLCSNNHDNLTVERYYYDKR